MALTIINNYLDNNIEINKNEILFWKVYRNIYLKKQIFKQLESEIYFKDYRMCNTKSRIKFKDIKSLKWMIDNCEFELLKRKIENKEFIQISGEGIKSLVNIKDHSISLEILEMLMRNQRDNMETLRPLDFAIKHENMEMVKVLINEPYSMRITLMNIQSAVRACSPQFLDELIPLSDIDIRTGSIAHVYWILNRCDYKKQDFLNVIVKYPETIAPLGQSSLYNMLPPTFILDITSITSVEQLFSLIQVNLFKKKNNLGIKELVSLITVYDKFKYSINISKILIFFALYIENNPIQNINEIKSKMFEIFNNTNNNNSEIEKQLFKLFILEINSKEIYEIYFYKYFELIEEMDNNKRYKTIKFLNILPKFNEIIKSNDKNEIVNFIIELINQGNLRTPKYNNLFKKIMDTIINYLMDDEYYYKIIINEIKRKNLEKLFSIPFEWSPILKEIMIEPIDGGLNKLFINDKETIDWLSSTFKLKLINHRNVKTIYNNKMKKGLVQFSTHQLYTYSILMLNKYSYGKSLMRSLIYPSIYSHPLITVNGNKEYLNKSEIMELLFKSIISYNLNETLLYVSLIDLKNDFKQFISIWNRKSKSNEYRFLFLDQLFSKTDIGTIKNIKVEIVIDSIKYWINEAKSNLQNNDLELLFETIINYLYKKLIQNQNVKINQVIEIRELILKLNIKLEHTEFHVFYYLNIRSPKLIRCLLLNESVLSSPLCIRFPDGSKYYCYNHINNKLPTNKVPKILVPTKISFDLLFGNNGESFINLLEYLYQFRPHNVDTLLKFYLDINRFDLFLKGFQTYKKATDYGHIKSITFDFIEALSVGNIDHSKLIIFQKYIDLVKISNFKDEIQFVQDMSNFSISKNRIELVSFIINYFKLKNLKIYRPTFNLCHYNIFKYIFENHFNDIKSISVAFIDFGECVSSSDTFIQDSILLFELFLKYYPSSLDNVSNSLFFFNIKRTKLNSKIFDYLLSKKLITQENHN
ncbi:hypothetical protein DDB_G0281421 [Dictyostelium discoideum AX4]|uniref:Uncharacterized protein n=1 Tax=Dictyostelium discoideum TaxID=44689 RepID=Q54TZ7_DICDI|nr:hypothetical protein DDB_G0281421 [Dictyostelium discoideum AX4]EAL66692.1 hypothetical protein DDB_G0281421 [Dictyostelium discoideum AX4]|eukprot:XP_640664.1 hypothetical protein DDB_G0281421 [Dictyostelium discoideum AX4]